MAQQAAPNHSDPARQPQRDIYYQAVEILRSMLPAPLTDTPEAWARRDRVAIAKVAAMVPDCDFEPPDPEFLHAIVTGDGSNLRWADTYEPWVAPEG